MPTIPVLDADGERVDVGAYLPGTKVAADSAPVTLSAEDKLQLAQLALIRDLIAGTDTQLPPTLGRKLPSASLAVVPARSEAAFGTHNTSAQGATFTALPDLACETLEIINTRPDAVDLQVRRGGSGGTMCLPAGSARLFDVTNANMLQVRRYDQASAVVGVDFEVRS